MFEAQLAEAGSAHLYRCTVNIKHMLCRSLGCLDPDCGLCRQTLHRRCVGTFAPKYLSGDQLKAKCGACIRVEVFDHSTGLLVPGEQLADLHLEVGMCSWA